jgi:enoyl-CoA hydratase/3-hydroxyacyl-CoA dehydrogenase
MGGQIAQTIAAAGIPVLLKDVGQELIDQGLAAARAASAGQLAGQVKKGKLTEEQAEAQVAEIIARITGTLDYSGFGDVDFVIEAVPERMEIKQAVFAELDAVCPGHAILASNTSSLSILEISEATLRPEKVVGFHYFYPASVMPLVEIVRSDDTSQETVQVALTFAQAIKKTPIVCEEVPGFVVNRILLSGLSEVLRAQAAGGLDIAQIDAALVEAKVVPMGPFALIQALGVDTFHHVSQLLAEAYGEAFYVSEGVGELVAAGKVGAKAGGDGVYAPDGTPQLAGDAAPDAAELVERLVLKTFVEACLVVEDAITVHRDVDVGMMSGAGMDPRRGILPPFMYADEHGLDTLLERLERAEAAWGEHYTPPRLLRRLVSQGRLGRKSGQGFYPYPEPDHGQAGEIVVRETRGDVAILWLSNAPMNAVSPQLVAELRAHWAQLRADGTRAVIIASANPLLFSAGADIKAFTQLDEASGAQFVRDTQEMFTWLGEGEIPTVAAVNGLAFGGGNELAISCDVRISAASAIFGQPEIKLGIIPGFGGTQRVARLIGSNKALELNLIGDPITAEEAYEYGMVNRLVPDHELFDTALMWAEKLAQQAPLAAEQVKKVSAKGDLQAGLEAEGVGFAAVMGSEDGREGIAAFLGKRKPVWRGR